MFLVCFQTELLLTVLYSQAAFNTVANTSLHSLTQCGVTIPEASHDELPGSGSAPEMMWRSLRANRWVGRRRNTLVFHKDFVVSDEQCWLSDNIGRTWHYIIWHTPWLEIKVCGTLWHGGCLWVRTDWMACDELVQKSPCSSTNSAMWFRNRTFGLSASQIRAL